MVFSSVIFLFAFLPLTIGLYYAVPKKFRNLVLLIANIVFYAWGEPVLILVMAFTTLINYVGALLIERFEGRRKLQRFYMIISVIISLSALVFFKYTGFLLNTFGLSRFFALPEVVLPIGISFYTFQTLSYTIDVYRHDAPAQHSFIKFATYVSLFPQLIAGPIVRYKDVADMLDSRTESIDKCFDGAHMFLCGLAKKLIIANGCGALFDALRAFGGNISVIGAWGGALAYTFQIYFDFSGYSDMALGLGKIFGFEFVKNFDYPYISRSITEFWRRWHISLSTWFRDYVYIPLGGNRKGRVRTYLNLFIVWFLTGLWHGASWNFVIWGLYYFVLLAIEKAIPKRIKDAVPKMLSWLITFILVMLGWVVFAIDDFSQLFTYISSMFSGAFANGDAIALLLEYLPLLIVGILASMPVFKQLYDRLKQKNKVVFITADALITIGCIIICTAILVSESYNPFLYFRF